MLRFFTILSLMYFLTGHIKSNDQPFSKGSGCVSMELPSLTDSHGHRIDCRQEAQVLQFWASWCHGCGATAVKVNRSLIEKMAASKGYHMINVDESIQDARGGLKKFPKYVKNLPVQFLFDDKAHFAKQLGINSYPSVALLNRGKVVKLYEGHMNAAQALELKKVVLNLTQSDHKK